MNDILKFIGNFNFEVIFAIITSLGSVLIKMIDLKKLNFRKEDEIIADLKVEEEIANEIDYEEETFTKKNIEIVIKSNSEINKAKYGVPQKQKPKVLKIFIVVALLYLVITTTLNWDNIIITKNTLLLYVGLFLMMCAGMFVSVIRKNYKTGKELFDIKDSDLIYPLLFSVFVFYPLLLLVESEQNSKLLFYTAFLNGYFWKTIVTEAEDNVKEKDDKVK